MNEKTASARKWLSRFLPLPTIIALAIAAYVFFMGDNSVVSRMRYEHTIDSLRVELAAQRDTMLYYRALNESLVHDPELMEHVVREQYNMKRTGEDVFVFDTPSGKNK